MQHHKEGVIFVLKCRVMPQDSDAGAACAAWSRGFTGSEIAREYVAGSLHKGAGQASNLNRMVSECVAGEPRGWLRQVRLRSFRWAGQAVHRMRRVVSSWTGCLSPPPPISEAQMRAFATLGARSAQAALSDPRLMSSASSSSNCCSSSVGGGPGGVSGAGCMGLRGCAPAGYGAHATRQEEAVALSTNRASAQCLGHALPLLESADSMSLDSTSSCFLPSPEHSTNSPRDAGIADPVANREVHASPEKNTTPQAALPGCVHSALPKPVLCTPDAPRVTDVTDADSEGKRKADKRMGTAAGCASKDDPSSLVSSRGGNGLGERSRCAAWGRASDGGMGACNGINASDSGSSGASFVYLDVTRASDSGLEAKRPSTSMSSTCDSLTRM